MIILILVLSHAVPAGEIHDAVKAGNIAKVRELLDANPDLVHAQTERGSTPLHFAVAIDNVEIIKLLIEKGADINAKTNKGYTPLHWAASVNASNAVEVLIAGGADVEAKTDDGATPLQRSIGKKADNVTQLLLTETPSSYTDRFLDTRFEEGQKALDSGELQRAYEIFTDLLKKEPGNERINFAYGMTCFALKDYSRARLAFERILYVNPGNDRVRLELARTYLASGQIDLAKEQFEFVLTRNPPESVQKNIQAYLEQIKRGTKRWSFSTRVDVGAFTDDNVNVGLDSKIINIAPIIYGASTISSLTIGETSLPVDTEGVFCSVALSGAYDTGKQGKWALTTDGSYYQNWLDNAYEHESLYGQVAVGLRHMGPRSMLKLPLTVAHISSGHDSLVNLYGISPSHLYVYGDKGEVRWQTDSSVEYRDYDELDDRDSFYFSIGETMTHYFGPQRHSVSMGVSLFHDHADADIYENTGGEWNLGGEFKLPWDCTLYAEVSYTTSDYAERETLAPETRTDSQNQFTAGLTKMINPSWGLDINYQITDNNSTYGLYQYDRNVTTISTFCSF